MNDLNIRCFLSISRTMSFTSTAKELAISQQAVSQNIRRLEEELNITLLTRNENAPYLTGAGRSFLKWAQNLDRSLANAAGVYSQKNGQCMLTVGVTDFTQLPPRICEIIQAFLDENPGVNIQFCCDSVQTLVAQMQDKNLDLCLLPGSCEPYLQDIVSDPLLYSVPLYLVTDAKVHYIYGNEKLPVLPYMDLLAVNLGEQTDQQVVFKMQSLCVRQGIPISNVRIVPNMNTLFMELCTGNGYAFIPMTPTLELWSHELFFQEINAELSFILARSINTSKPIVDDFMNHLKKIVAQEGGEQLHDKYRSRMFP